MNYNSWMVTEKLIGVEDSEVLLAEIALINDLQDDFIIGTEVSDGLNIVVEGDNVVWVGGYDASLTLWSTTLADLIERAPPREWSDIEKRGHSDVFGYPLWLPDVMDGDEFDVIAFLQRHIEKDEIGVIVSVGHEGLRYVDSMVCAFNKTTYKVGHSHETVERLRLELGAKQEETNYGIARQSRRNQGDDRRNRGKRYDRMETNQSRYRRRVRRAHHV